MASWNKMCCTANLILKGYGDPKLTLEKLWLWLHELRSRGLREIRGDLVLDRSVFSPPRTIPQNSIMSRCVPTIRDQTRCA